MDFDCKDCVCGTHVTDASETARAHWYYDLFMYEICAGCDEITEVYR